MSKKNLMRYQSALGLKLDDGYTPSQPILTSLVAGGDAASVIASFLVNV